jgi:hypothetical protein
MMDNWWLRKMGKLGYMWIMRDNEGVIRGNYGLIRGVIRGN